MLLTASDLCKVRIDLSSVAGAPVAGELLWAEALGDDLYRLRNIPGFAFGLSEGDVVRCTLREGVNTVTSLVHDSGNGVVRVYFRGPSTSDRERVCVALRRFGCTHEVGRHALDFFTVPASSIGHLHEIARILNEEDAVEAWEIGKEPTRPQVDS
ncbi:MAG: DUF4265 domain-containing protein [Polyangiales bacterium]